MSDIALAQGRPVAARPERPRRPWTVWVVVAGLTVFTLWAAWPRPIGIGLDRFTWVVDNFGRGSRIIAEFLAPNWTFLPRTVGPFVETFQIAILATVLGCGLALPVALLASRVTTPNVGVYGFVRTSLNVIRSLPDVLYAMIFVAAVGFGPLAGILALVFFNLGITAKLTSETVDGIDRGPLEAANATGANRVQAAARAVVPQILPNYVAYSLYVFELNVRASLVLGFVGAGGVGTLLVTQLQRFNYPNAAVIIVLTFFIVFALDRASLALRRRLV